MALATTSTPGSIILSGDLTGNANAPALRPTGVVPGSYTAANIVVDSKGRVVYGAAGNINVIADATTSSKGLMQVGNNISVSSGVISIPDTTTSVKGVVQIGSGLSISSGVVSLVSVDTTTLSKGVVQIGTNMSVTSGIMSIPDATSSSKGAVQVGTNLSVSSGVLSFSPTDATTGAKGVVQVGSGLDVTGGVLSISYATTSSKGIVQIGDGINVATGVISVADATTTNRGLVQIGTNINVSSGVISVADATTSSKGVMQVGTGLTASAGVLSTDSTIPLLDTNNTFTAFQRVVSATGGNGPTAPDPSTTQIYSLTGTAIVVSNPVNTNVGDRFALILTKSAPSPTYLVTGYNIGTSLRWRHAVWNSAGSVWYAISGGAGFGTVYSSSNGTSWSNSGMSVPNDITQFAYNGTTWVGVASNTAYYGSTIALGTSAGALPGGFGTARGIATKGSTFVTIDAAGAACYSTNGSSWTAASLASVSGQPTAIASNSSIFVVVDAGGGINTSTNGSSWTARTGPGAGYDFSSVVWTGSLFVATCGFSSPTANYATSPDGITWTARTLPASVNNSKLAFDGAAVWVISYGSSSTIYASLDAISWTSPSNGGGTVPVDVSGIAGNGSNGIVIVGGYSTNTITNGVFFGGSSGTAPSVDPTFGTQYVFSGTSPGTYPLVVNCVVNSTNVMCTYV